MFSFSYVKGYTYTKAILAINLRTHPLLVHHLIIFFIKISIALGGRDAMSAAAPPNGRNQNN